MYRGRLAPSPTGRLHFGHAFAFHQAWQRAQDAHGELLLRIEDLDPDRCRPEFVASMLADLAWMGLDWKAPPVFQSKRKPLYLAAWKRLRDSGHIYPCTRSRRELREAVSAPHEDDGPAEPIYPAEWRPPPNSGKHLPSPAGVNWRFRVPDTFPVTFTDGQMGPQKFTTCEDFGDFLIWRKDDVPAYELAVVVDDADQAITEVVRGADLLRSTARQLLLYDALGLTPPGYFHVPLIRDADGKRLSKREGALALETYRLAGIPFARALRDQGHTWLE